MGIWWGNFGVKLKKILLFAFGIFLVVFASLSFAQGGNVIMTKDPSAIYFVLGKYYFSNNDFVKASHFFERAVEINPDFAEAHHNLGITYYKLNRDDNAIIELGEAIGLKNDYAKAYYSMALIYYEHKDYENAIRSFLKVVQLDPNNANANFDLAVVYAEKFRGKELGGSINSDDLSDLKEALKYYLEVIDIDSNFPHALSNAEIIKNIIKIYEQEA